MTSCLGWNSEHKFEPRYSTYEHSNNCERIEGKMSVSNLRTLLIRQDVVYEGDVCVKCGMRSDPSADLAGRKTK